ncbi:Uncharacterised protein [Brevibacterium casei]|uniref:Uncharacterized protein n=1 Tax=Brevibacterium casei TaxID=33889 RepID=A0A449D7S6_9MICO|nr:hypothetical protein [Brevibacterium casei]VEW13546.1 Uncharacterised protein [Brevibacterium casei]
MSDPSPAQRVRNACDSIHDALNLAEHPPAPRGGQSGATSGSRPPMPVAILDAKLDLKQKLTSWALMIGEEGGFVIDCDDDTLSIAAWVYTKADWLSAHPAAEDFTEEIEECVNKLTSPYLTRAQMEFCGEHQGEKIYVRRGQATVELADGRVEQVKTLKAWSHSRMLDVVDTPKRVAEIITIVFGHPISGKTITTAYSDDHNPNRPHPSKILEPALEEGRRKFYKVSDVMDRFGMLPGVTEESAVS